MPVSIAIDRMRAFSDLHFYQKWHAVWPVLSALPQSGVRLLDAGCGEGRWSAEIAQRRPAWEVCGIDRDATGLAVAEMRRDARRLDNLRYELADFERFAPAPPVDVVLSVCSAHYEQSAGDTARLFEHMADWLKPSGHLVLLVPRRLEEAPFVERLGHPAWHEVFSRAGLSELCAAAGLVAERIEPRIGRLGTLAKQLDWRRPECSAPAGGAIGLLARGVALVGTRVAPDPASSLMWLVVARRRAA